MVWYVAVLDSPRFDESPAPSPDITVPKLSHPVDYNAQHPAGDNLPCVARILINSSVTAGDLTVVFGPRYAVTVVLLLAR